MKKINLYDYQQEMLENITKALTGRSQVTFYDQNGKKIETLGTGASSATAGGLTDITADQIRNAYVDREYINTGYEVGTDGHHTKKTINWN